MATLTKGRKVLVKRLSLAYSDYKNLPGEVIDIHGEYASVAVPKKLFRQYALKLEELNMTVWKTSGEHQYVDGRYLWKDTEIFSFGPVRIENGEEVIDGYTQAQLPPTIATKPYTLATRCLEKGYSDHAENPPQF